MDVMEKLCLQSSKLQRGRGNANAKWHAYQWNWFITSKLNNTEVINHNNNGSFIFVESQLAASVRYKRGRTRSNFGSAQSHHITKGPDHLNCRRSPK